MSKTARTLRWLVGSTLMGWALTASAQSARPRFDPILPEALRPVVQAAVAAELDPTRGPGNAIAILQDARARAPREAHRAYDLRIAAIGLRRAFLTQKGVPEATRYEHALSTFSPFSLGEPGLADWLKKALEHHPDAADRWKNRRPIRIRLEALSPDLSGKAMREVWREAFTALGLSLHLVNGERKASRPGKVAADWRIKVALEPRPSRGGQVEVRAGAELQRTAPSPTAPVQRFARIGRAKTLGQALKGAHGDLVRVAGHALFFAWLKDRLMPDFEAVPGPKGTPEAPGLHRDHRHSHH